MSSKINKFFFVKRHYQNASTCLTKSDAGMSMPVRFFPERLRIRHFPITNSGLSITPILIHPITGIMACPISSCGRPQSATGIYLMVCCFLIDSPVRVIRWALWMRRSSSASATVPLLIIECHCSTGSWLQMMVLLTPCLSSTTSSKSVACLTVSFSSPQSSCRLAP